MGRTSTVLPSLTRILEGKLLLKDKLNLSRPIDRSDLIRDVDELQKVEQIQSFIVQGGYLPKSPMFNNHRALLKVFRLGITHAGIADLLNIHVSSVNRMANRVEAELNKYFPADLCTMLEQHKFDDILHIVSVSQGSFLKESSEQFFGKLESSLKPYMPKIKSSSKEGTSSLSLEDANKLAEHVGIVCRVASQLNELAENSEVLLSYVKVKNALARGHYVPKQVLDLLEGEVGDGSN